MNPQALELYQSLIRERMAEEACQRCGASLGAGRLVSVDGGATLDDYGLSDESIARLLAATEHLSVQCSGCGAPGDIGLGTAPQPPPVEARPEAPWDPQAVALYQSLVRERLKEQTCTACGASLESAAVTLATGGAALGDYALGDDVAARVLAATQSLSVQCPECSASVDI